MDCRGHEKRLRIVQEYKIIPIAHIKLLNGKIISSDAGGDITDSYFMFNCISKTTNEREIIYCGKPTAIDFCNLTNQKLPDLFNPLKCTSVSGKLNKNNIREAEMIDKKWNPMRKQLYNATMLLIAIFDAKPDTPLFVIKEELETYVDREPFLARIKAINTIISKTNKTMRDIIDELGKNNDLKSFSFDLFLFLDFLRIFPCFFSFFSTSRLYIIISLFSITVIVIILCFQIYSCLHQLLRNK